MEQAVNTFNKGLQTDTHPMVQSNDTLSNALNATFITQNGNEVILQNDMGNRRVDNAYLPNGYEPVGIKEYGGIIYIAAYNPITNKSQIGSFPSPERKIGNDDTNKTSITLNTEFNKKEESFGESFAPVQFLQNDTALFPLTKDTSLHAGDKFVVYTEKEIDEKEQITNYFNTKDGKVISPKNKLYTLALGILNSQNEFVDITNTLARWDKIENKTEKQVYTNNESSLYQFNDKYFIASNSDGSEFKNTIDDTKLIQERLLGMQIQNANTYAYKLVGPLYLKATLNHVQNFTYNIYGIKNQNGVTLWVVGNYIYNCPDGTSGLDTDKGDDDYLKYDIGQPNSNFSFTFETNPSSNPEITDKYPQYTISTYDKSQNLYKVTITNKYNINISSLPTDNKIKYRILVKANSESDFYLKGLSDFGTIDISKLGSGELGVKGWRFLNSISSGFTNLTYVLDAYPKYGEEFTDLRICFKELKAKDNLDSYSRIKPDSKGEAPSDIISLPYYIEGTVYNGRNTISFYWNEIGLQSRSVYDVYIIYKSSESPNWKLLGENSRWFITTELFNDWYDVNNDNYTVDFCNKGEDGNYDNKLKEKLTITLNAKANNTLNLKSPTITNNGNYFSTTNSNIKFTTKQNIKGTNTISPEFQIEDEILYPSDLVISDSANSNLTIDSAITNNKSDINNRIEKYTENDLDESPGVSVTTTLLSGNKSFSIDYTITDSFQATTKPGTDIEVTNVYDTIQNLVKTIYDSAEGIWNHYSGAICDFTEHTGPDDEHHIRVIINASISKEEWEPHAGQYNQVKLITREEDDPIEFFMSEIKGLFFDAMNQNPDNLIFTYIVSTYPGSHIVEKKGDWDHDQKGTKVELYWRGTQNTWAVSKELISQSNGIVSPVNIANIFDKNAVMCCYKTKPNDLNIYIANDYNANKFFKDILEISYKLKYTKDYSNIIKDKAYNNQLQFTIKALDFKSEKISIDISSSEEFQDKVNQALNVTSISNIFIGNGSTLDSNEEPLRPNRIYLLNDNKLYYNSSSKIYVNGESSDSYYFPLYNGLSAGTPKYIKHCGADNDSNTYLNFSGIKSFNISNIS